MTSERISQGASYAGTLAQRARARRNNAEDVNSTCGHERNARMVPGFSAFLLRLQTTFIPGPRRHIFIQRRAKTAPYNGDAVPYR